MRRQGASPPAAPTSTFPLVGSVVARLVPTSLLDSFLFNIPGLLGQGRAGGPFPPYAFQRDSSFTELYWNIKDYSWIIIQNFSSLAAFPSFFKFTTLLVCLSRETAYNAIHPGASRHCNL